MFESMFMCFVRNFCDFFQDLSCLRIFFVVHIYFFMSVLVHIISVISDDLNIVSFQCIFGYIVKLF